MAGNINDSRTVERVYPVRKGRSELFSIRRYRRKIIGIMNLQDNDADKFSMHGISYIGNFKLILL